MTLARDAPACSLCRRFAPYDRSDSEAEKSNPIINKLFRPLHFGRGDYIYMYLQVWEKIVIDARTRRICLLAMPSLSLLTTEVEKSHPIN